VGVESVVWAEVAEGEICRILAVWGRSRERKLKAREKRFHQDDGETWMGW